MEPRNRERERQQTGPAGNEPGGEGATPRRDRIADVLAQADELVDSFHSSDSERFIRSSVQRVGQ